ncbi:MAG: glycosyltransferase [Acidobacteriia bacterium]|nr:glycosyltransferase [Terriglobia bacterium]
MPGSLPNLRVAIVHYWFMGYAGGERVVAALAEMFPQADLFALMADPRALTPELSAHRLTTSFLQKIPGNRRWYRHLLPLQPIALEQLDVSGYDLILSSESGPAKGVISPAHACHICYCHSPMRYLWDMYHEYRQNMGPVMRAFFSATAHYIRMWDLASAARVDHFVANSFNVAARIRKHYRRESSVIHPPATITDACVADRTEDYYLVVSRLIDYKRVDLAIAACKRLGRRLRIVGDGDQYKQLRKLAGPGIEFLGYLREPDLHTCYAHCRALLFPGEEDFGIVPVEAQSFGRPVIAYGRGGALETVIGQSADDYFLPEKSTGVFFSEQTPESVADAIHLFESAEAKFDPNFIHASAQRFDLSRFKSNMHDLIGQCLEEHRDGTEPFMRGQTVSTPVPQNVA